MALYWYCVSLWPWDLLELRVTLPDYKYFILVCLFLRCTFFFNLKKYIYHFILTYILLHISMYFINIFLSLLVLLSMF